MARTKIDAVVFDLGGVLVRIARGWDDAHRLAGFDDDHPGLTHEGFREHGPRLATEHMSGKIGPDEWAGGVEGASEGHYSAADAMRIMDAWTIEEYAGIRGVIDTIHDAGIATAALSNTNARHWQLLGADDESFADYPNLGALQQLHASHILGHVKPDFAIYDAFTEAADLGSARVLFFDDTKPNVDAARRYGWSARHIDYAGDPVKQMKAALTHHRITD